MNVRVGVLGGTFDPVHSGHLAAAEAARVALRLDRLVLMPSLSPPHRPARPVASAFHRFAMASLAIEDRPHYVVSDLELQQGTPSYTSETLARLHAEGYDPTRLFFIVGADAFADIATWHEYPAILSACHFVVVSRPGTKSGDMQSRLPQLRDFMKDATANAVEDAPPSIILVDALTPDVSSSRIRALLAGGKRVTGMLPAAVEDHARRHGLYTAAAPTVHAPREVERARHE
jgi:nicotinate-nucleotide adenylyltransferase